MKKLILIAVLLNAACGGGGGGSICSKSGSANCLDPGGNGYDLCCPQGNQIYCKADNGCHASSDPFFSCSTGKTFCSCEWEGSTCH